MFEKLMAERAAAPTPVESWFATHPTEEERVARANRAIAKIDPAVLALGTVVTIFDPVRSALPKCLRNLRRPVGY